MFGRGRDYGVPRDRSVWFALGTGVVICVAAAAFILLPLMGLIGAGASAAPVIRIPVVQIGLVVIAGYLLALGLLVLSGRSKRGAVAWVLSIAAIVATVVVSVYPAVAVAIVAGDRIGEFIPWATDLVRNFGS